MKRLLVVLGAVLFASTIVVSNLFAYTYSHSTSFVRTQSRAATLDVDAVYYNPVGLVKMEDGLYLDLGDQMGAKRYAHSISIEGGNWHDDNTPSFTIPNAALVFKKGNGALFGSIYIPAGGGTLEYKEPLGMPITSMLLTYVLTGTANGSINHVKGTSFWIQSRIGGSFALTDWLALTGGLMLSYYSYEISLGLTYAGRIGWQETSAFGASGFGGLMITPADIISITALYSSMVVANGTTKDNKLHYNAAHIERLPDYILLGINLKPAEIVEIQFSYQLNFSGERKLGSRNNPNQGAAMIMRELGLNAVGGNYLNYKKKNNHKIGLGFEFPMEKLTPSFGISYETHESQPSLLGGQNPLDPDLENIGIGLGLKIKPIENFSIDLAGARYIYISEKIWHGLMKLEKEVWSFGINLSAKVM